MGGLSAGVITVLNAMASIFFSFVGRDLLPEVTVDRVLGTELHAGCFGRRLVAVSLGLKLESKLETMESWERGVPR